MRGPAPTRCLPAPAIAAAWLSLAAAWSVTTGCDDPIAGAREHVIDGRFDRWPAGDADEGDAWRIDGDGALAIRGSPPHLAIEATEGGGATTLVPVVPGREHRLALRHRGGAGRLEITLDDGGGPLVAELPASDDWTELRADLWPARDGLRLRLLDAPGDDAALRVDDVSLAWPSAGDVRHEPPIQLLLVTHAESDVGTAERYVERRDALLELAELAESHGMRLTALLSGAFAEWAVWQGDEARFADLLDRGHEIGTYVFPVYHVEHLHWTGGDIFDDGMADRQWTDHRRWVDELVGAEHNTTVCAYAPTAEMADLMADHGFELDLASVAVNTPHGTSRESVAWRYLGHHPHHPFRPADRGIEGTEYAGDPDGPYLSIGHAAQVGRPLAHGGPCGADDYARLFGLLRDRWLAHRRAPAGAGDDRVWVFGVLHNLKHHDTFRDALVEVLDELRRNGLDARDDGAPVAAAATAREVAAQYRAWEADHPDDPGFSFTLPP